MSSNRPPPPQGGPRGPLRSGAATKASSESSTCPDPRWFGGTGFFPFLPRFCFLAGALGLTLLPSAGASSLRLLDLSSKMAPTASLPARVVGCGVEQLIGVDGSASRKLVHQVPARRTL